MITLESKFKLNGNYIDVTNIKDKANLARLNLYYSMISSLGIDLNTLKMQDEEDIYNFFKLDFSSLKKICDVY